MKTRDMAYIALMAVLISVCSWLSVPSVIPFTMQTFGVFCALLLLGGRRGAEPATQGNLLENGDFTAVTDGMTDEMAEAYFDENAETYAESRIEKKNNVTVIHSFNSSFSICTDNLVIICKYNILT